MAPIMSMDLQCTHCTALLQDDTTREILEELDRERTRRAELEAQVRWLLQEKESRESADDKMMTLSRKHFIALQTELKGYRDLIDAMTKERPAIAAALASSTRQRMVPFDKKDSKNNNNALSVVPPSLPLHVIRLLEVMPWDPRAKEYAFAKEEVYEWQFYNPQKLTWKTELRTSPKEFKDLPTEEPKATAGVNAVPESNSSSNNNNKFLAFFNQESAPPDSCVLTNQNRTKLYNLQKGYPLPENGGTWQWVGGWRVEKRISLNDDVSSSSSNNSRQRQIDVDDEGFSYAMEASHFLLENPAEWCWDHAGDDGTSVIRPVRRRKWTRQRALVDYPHASEQTKSFLNLMSSRMYANMAANKMSEQLVHTKVALTTVESVLLQCKDESAHQVHLLSELLQPKKKSKVSNAEDAKAVVIAVSDAAQKMQDDIALALALSVRNQANNSLPSSR